MYCILYGVPNVAIMGVPVFIISCFVYVCVFVCGGRGGIILWNLGKCVACLKFGCSSGRVPTRMGDFSYLFSKHVTIKCFLAFNGRAVVDYAVSLWLIMVG